MEVAHNQLGLHVQLEWHAEDVDTSTETRMTRPETQSWCERYAKQDLRAKFYMNRFIGSQLHFAWPWEYYCDEIVCSSRLALHPANLKIRSAKLPVWAAPQAHRETREQLDMLAGFIHWRTSHHMLHQVTGQLQNMSDSHTAVHICGVTWGSVHARELWRYIWHTHEQAYNALPRYPRLLMTSDMHSKAH